jgi:MoaA/NifB/PqqE/SkfB family radical SAM enzyme
MENKIPKCIAPWVYLDILPEGTVVPCCSNPTELGNLKFQTLDEIWNGDAMKKLRLEMFGDQLPQSCEVCNSQVQGETLKDFYNQKFKDSFSEVETNTLDDGSVKDIKIKGFDFRISNKCNFKCRTCWAKLSSSINFETRTNNLGAYYEDPILSITNYFDFKKMYQDNVNNLELIEFSGGEVLLMDEHYEMLEYFIANNKQSQIELRYNTNFSTINYKNYDIINLWSKWDPSKLFVSISIDEIGTRSEYVRYGTVWNNLSSNIKKIISSFETEKFNNRFLINANIVVSIFNVNRIPEILTYLLDIGFIRKEYNFNNFVLSPEGNMRNGIYNLELYPIEQRQQIKEKLLNFSETYPVNIDNHIRQIVEKLDNPEPPDKNKIKEFLEDTKKIDKIRNQNLLEVIPELQCLVDYVS